jgi:hypothetical protein
MKQPARHGAIQLGRSHVLIFGDIVNAVDECGAFAPISRRINRELSGPVRRQVSRSNEMIDDLEWRGATQLAPKLIPRHIEAYMEHSQPLV